jgi:hypothetical protein
LSSVAAQRLSCENFIIHAVKCILIEAFANCPVQTSRGIRNVEFYALYGMLCLVPNREAAENIRRPDKAVSPTYCNA